MDAMIQRTKRRGSLTLRMILMIVATVVVLLVIMVVPFWGFIGPMIFGGGKPNEEQPPVVSTIVAQYEDWQPHLNVVGTLRPVNGSDLAFEVPGVVDKVFFDSGGDVAAGTPLVMLRQGDDLARLHTLQAAADLARTVYARAQKLFAINAISRQELDQDAAQLRSAEAQVAEQQAILAKKTLRAPFAGHIGLRQVNVGQYVNAGVAVVTLQVLDPIYLDFTVPQQSIASLKLGQHVVAHFDAYPGVDFGGEITSIDPKADPSTRNVAVRATLANHGRRLVPGMYATAQVEVGAPQKFLTLPQTAITFNPFGSTAWSVERQRAGKGSPEQLVARENFVTTGDTRGDQIQVLTGLKAGQEIVTAGQIKLQNGSPVAINNKVQPSNNPNPAPVEH